MWLASEVAKTITTQSTVIDGVMRCIRNSKGNVESLFDLFDAHVDAAVLLHHSERVFTDTCNAGNLARFVFDYMTIYNIPRFFDFYGGYKTSQLYNFTDT